MDWKAIGIWVVGIVTVLAASGFAIKFVFSRKNRSSKANTKTIQKGNIVGGNMAGRDNTSNNQN